MIRGLLGALPYNVYSVIRNILSSIYIVLALVVGVILLLHIFKTRYLDYYEIVKEENVKESNEKNNDTNTVPEQLESEGKKKIFIEKNEEKILIMCQCQIIF